VERIVIEPPNAIDVLVYFDDAHSSQSKLMDELFAREFQRVIRQREVTRRRRLAERR